MAIKGTAPRRAVAAAVVVLYLAGVTVGLAFESVTAGSDGNVLESALLILGFGTFTVLGALLVVRRPGHPLGPIFAAIGLAVGIGFLGNGYASWHVTAGRDVTLLARVLAWPNAWYWYPILGLVFVFVPLLFPDGRLPSRRWRWVAWPVGIAVGAGTVMAALAERIPLQTVGADGEWLTVANPFGVTGLVDVESNPLFGTLIGAILPGMVAGIVAIVVRFRRSRGVERQQMKWFLFAAALLPVAPLSELVPGAIGDVIGGFMFGVVILFLPASIGIAVLRYRLYEIDRIVSRTVTYALVVGVLAAVYAGLVVGLSGLVPAAGTSDLTVAGSTLIVAALFGPVLRRVRSFVDRHFNRSRYDAAQAAENFAQRLRDQVDLESVAEDLRTTVGTTLAPATVSLWLREEPS